jgi:DNA helicase HerA-like ATPase
MTMNSNQPSFQNLARTAATQDNPIDALRVFLENEVKLETATQTNKMRFVGYVLELSYDTAKIITSDPYKVAVGGIPRGSFLIMTPEKFDHLPLHFTLLRVTGVSPTPLSNQVQQTYFELHKKSMPELDVWTQSELQWGALDCDVLGMFYPDPENKSRLAFSGDVNNVVSAHRYKVFSPDELLLKLIVNGTVKPDQQFEIGALRTMECKLVSNNATPNIPVRISMQDFKGCRTAMFGKTRLGKSNVVKLIAQGMLEATRADKSVGQLIFDINGEYANDNEQNVAIRSAYPDRCQVYALTKRAETPSKDLRLNFYEQPESCIGVIKSLLEKDSRGSDYIRSFANVELPSIESILALPGEKRDRPIRKIQIYWAILKKAGFPVDSAKLKTKNLTGYNAKHFSPHFKKELREAAYKYASEPATPEHPTTLEELVSELETIAAFVRENPSDKTLRSSSSNDAIFDASDLALLRFFAPGNNSSGPMLLRAYLSLHSPSAENFIKEILDALDKGQTVILDLGSATDAIRRYFSDLLSWEVFGHQEAKFTSNTLDERFVQLYFEEAHNLFPPDSKDLTGVYARFAKEGAKFHVGMVYSTQSPSTINKELLAQTENFFVGHLSSQDETKSLSRVQIAFSGIEEDILRAKTVGYMRMLTMSHRFVIPTQAKKFEANAAPAAANP